MTLSTILIGDVRARLAELPADSVHCVVTSPPYWGLRDYGTATWEGGEAGCDHKVGELRLGKNLAQSHVSTRGGAKKVATVNDIQARDVCPKCGARRLDQQLGLEATPEMHVAAMVEVFREVRRVLRPDGVCWVNYGDCYASAWACKRRSVIGLGSPGEEVERGRTGDGLKEKDLVGMPWRIAFALQADGWWLRADCIWAKPNPMPESVTDRPTKAHEYVFLLTKRARYFYDAEAVREEQTGNSHPQNRGPGNPGANKIAADGNGNMMNASKLESLQFRGNDIGRNLRSVWTIPTFAFPEAHFATFPPKLAETCIRAGTSEKGCCPVCGAPWVRVVEKSGGTTGHSWHDHEGDAEKGQRAFGTQDGTYRRQAMGWELSCDCAAVIAESLPPIRVPHEPVPCTVLDPFAGAGTTLLMADRLGRRGIGIELNPEYAAMAQRRLAAETPLIDAAQSAAEAEQQSKGEQQELLGVEG